jgi:hypothetical protein
VEKEKLAAIMRAAEEREAARVADVASEQRELTDTTLGAIKELLHKFFQRRVVLEGSQLRDFDAVLKQMLTLGDLGNGGSVERRLGLIKQIVDSIHSDFETAPPTAATPHDPLGARRGVLAAGYGAAISECLGALLTLRRLTALTFNDVPMRGGEGMADYIERARTESSAGTQECAVGSNR